MSSNTVVEMMPRTTAGDMLRSGVSMGQIKFSRFSDGSALVQRKGVAALATIEEIAEYDAELAAKQQADTLPSTDYYVEATADGKHKFFILPAAK